MGIIIVPIFIIICIIILIQIGIFFGKKSIGSVGISFIIILFIPLIFLINTLNNIMCDLDGPGNNCLIGNSQNSININFNMIYIIIIFIVIFKLAYNDIKKLNNIDKNGKEIKLNNIDEVMIENYKINEVDEYGLLTEKALKERDRLKNKKNIT